MILYGVEEWSRGSGTVIDHIIFSCVLKDRFIGENIRLIDSVIHYTMANKVPGLLLLLDFEKAFDTVEWPAFH